MINNATARAKSAAIGANGANGRMHVPLDSVEPLSWYARFFTREDIVVGGREIKNGWVIPQPLGIALILVMISTTGVLYWRIVDKQALAADKAVEMKELIIRLDQRLIDKNEHDDQRFQEMKQAITDTQEHQAAVETVTNKEIAQLKAKVR